MVNEIMRQNGHFCATWDICLSSILSFATISFCPWTKLKNFALTRNFGKIWIVNMFTFFNLFDTEIAFEHCSKKEIEKLGQAFFYFVWITGGSQSWQMALTQISEKSKDSIMKGVEMKNICCCWVIHPFYCQIYVQKTMMASTFISEK